MTQEDPEHPAAADIVFGKAEEAGFVRRPDLDTAGTEAWEAPSGEIWDLQRGHLLLVARPADKP